MLILSGCGHKSASEKERAAQMQEQLKKAQPGDILAMNGGSFAIIQSKNSADCLIRYAGIGASRIDYYALSPKVSRVYSYDDPGWNFAVKKWLEPILSSRDDK